MKVIKNRDKKGEFGTHKPYFRLEEIISKTEMDKNITFEVLLKIPKWGKAISGDGILGFKLFDGTTVDCTNQCDELME